MAEGSPSWIDARARDAEHREMLVALRFHSRLTVPLLADSHVLGAISLVTSASGRRYTERDCLLAEALASMCALAISNARLLSQAARSRARHEVLVRTMRRWRAAEQVDELLRDLLRDARDLVGGMQAAIQPWDEHRQMLVGGWCTLVGDLTTEVHSGQGVSGRAAFWKQTVVANEYQRDYAGENAGLPADIEAVLASPLLGRSRLLGVLTVTREGKKRESFQPFGQEDVETLELVAGLVSSLLLERSRPLTAPSGADGGTGLSPAGTTTEQTG
ncbi:MAG: GAF domain-containing protein [Chloroflexi bacterium]|nr:GAF domain-containing protein [Chloroflexota bacterium]